MKKFLIALSLFAFAACGGGTKPPAQVTIPADADIKADVMLRGSGSSRTIEVSFYISRPVAPGDKTEPKLETVPVEDVRFNETQLNEKAGSEGGRAVYTAEDLPIQSENLVAAKIGGRQYEGKAMTQTTLPNRSASIVMVAK